MKEEKRITYQAGITLTPSDFLCKDGDLAECINLTTDHEELKTMVQPREKQTINSDYTLVYIHSFNGTTRYIVWKTAETARKPLYWTLNPSSDVAADFTYMMIVDVNTLQIQSIGNTLIVSSGGNASMGFFLWKDATYKDLGSQVPDIRVKFSLGDFGYLQGDDANPDKYGRVPGMHGEILLEITETDPFPVTDEYAGNVWGSEEAEGDMKWDSGYETGKEALAGIVSAQLDWVKEKKRFAFPFWARSAVRLYDGRHVNISNPFLLLPTVMNNWHIFAYDRETDGPKVIDGDAGGYPVTAYRPYCARLYYKTDYGAQDLTDWEDIISGVDIFVSEEVKSFDVNGGWTIINNCVRSNNTALLGTVDACMPQYDVLASMPAFDGRNSLTWQTFYKPSLLSEGEMTHRLLEKSIFYKIIELDFDEIESCSYAFQDATDKIDRGVLKNLVNNQTLQNDDFFSRSYMRPQVIKAYNNRLHLADVRRSFFWGFDRFSYTAHSDAQISRIYVYIRSDDGTKIVKEDQGAKYEIGDVWFYYPDPRAFKAEIWVGNNKIYSLSLKEHPRLNGAYYFGHLPDSVDAWPSGIYYQDTPTVSDDNTELLEGEIFVSEVDNPWVYTALGHVTVGRGKILGMASQTVALGQEEHGIHPLAVFSERGISTLRLDKEGVYQRSDDLPREVCTNKDSITETDGAIFFVSKKGLMVLVGEKATCVTPQMDGATFNNNILPGIMPADFNDQSNPAKDWAGIITSCRGTNFQTYIQASELKVAYDYVDSRLLLINPLYSFIYVYNISDGTVSKMVLDMQVESVVNCYPDYLIQFRIKVPNSNPVHAIFTLYGKDREQSVTARQTAFMLTRPMKLAGPLTVASLRELVNVGMWERQDAQGNALSCVKTDVWVSDDLYKWYALSSRFGAAARYFRIGLYIKMLPSERLSGTVIAEQERRDNNRRA